MKYFCSLLIFFGTAPFAQATDWSAREEYKYYRISGASGPELYSSIGTNGPKIGTVRTIAHTNWALKWSRNYVAQQDRACLLVSAKPFLTITYTLPQPEIKLTGRSAARWENFSNGIAAHERAHAKDIVAMVNEIIDTTVGLRVEQDPDCKTIRDEVLTQVKAANENYKTKSRAFDQIEMSNDGNVQRLILGLVN